MHTYTTMAMLLNLLVSSLFLALPNSVEARKFTKSSNNGGVFKVDLIHRDSPHSPYYNSSMTPQERLRRSPLGSISRGHNIQLSSRYYTSAIELSNLIPDGGGYLLKIGVGTPTVDFFALADTGSDLIWVQCLPCENCISKLSPPFDPTKSSTFQAIPCNTPACSKPDLPNTGCSLENTTKSTTCHYQYNYGSGSSGGILAMETISLPSSDGTSLSSIRFIFGCGMSQTVFNREDGIIGLGTGPSSLISQLGLGINHKFSYCLPPLTSGVNGKLVLGADVTGPGVVSTPFLLGHDSSFYHLILNGIGVGDDEISMPSSLDIIIDSGTTYTMLPESVYGNVKTALENAIGLSTTPSPVETLDLCYNLAGGQFNTPNVVFHFKGADVELSAYNIFREVEDGVHCLAMVATTKLAIFGNIAQVNFQVGYDVEAQTVSFASADCTTY